MCTSECNTNHYKQNKRTATGFSKPALFLTFRIRLTFVAQQKLSAMPGLMKKVIEENKQLVTSFLHAFFYLGEQVKAAPLLLGTGKKSYRKKKTIPQNPRF